ncbi:hypothetical protein CC86DRAFT_432224 [Ophiobolus disseminans]|uniref:Uncharacterized protein n=1 Tax=Ophiobolus disseminans TaxID=1469910 RepID=A0A6A6ZDU4_9PLEO|nr:hypothetical protein CC86DRAFT_432224 [Ophiobolus disseminans]
MPTPFDDEISKVLAYHDFGVALQKELDTIKTNPRGTTLTPDEADIRDKRCKAVQSVLNLLMREAGPVPKTPTEITHLHAEWKEAVKGFRNFLQGRQDMWIRRIKSQTSDLTSMNEELTLRWIVISVRIAVEWGLDESLSRSGSPLGNVSAVDMLSDGFASVDILRLDERDEIDLSDEDHTLEITR